MVRIELTTYRLRGGCWLRIPSRPDRSNLNSTIRFSEPAPEERPRYSGMHVDAG